MNLNLTSIFLLGLMIKINEKNKEKKEVKTPTRHGNPNDQVSVLKKGSLQYLYIKKLWW